MIWEVFAQWMIQTWKPLKPSIGKTASALSYIRHGDYYRRVLLEDERNHKEPKEMLTGRRIAFVICDHLKKSKIEGAISDISDLIALELIGDDLNSFDTAWDEVLLGKDEAPEPNILESLYLLTD